MDAFSPASLELAQSLTCSQTNNPMLYKMRSGSAVSSVNSSSSVLGWAGFKVTHFTFMLVWVFCLQTVTDTKKIYRNADVIIWRKMIRKESWNTILTVSKVSVDSKIIRCVFWRFNWSHNTEGVKASLFWETESVLWVGWCEDAACGLFYISRRLLLWYMKHRGCQTNLCCT